MIPSLYDITLPILKICQDKDRKYRTYDIVDKLAKLFSLTKEEREQLLPSRRQTTLYNRTSWALFELAHAGLLSRENRKYAITKDGAVIISKKPAKIDRKFLMDIPKYRKWKKETSKNKSEKKEEDDAKAPTEIIETNYELIKQAVEYDILEKINGCTPKFFEQLVLDVIRKMGYGRDGQVIGSPGDGGIDGEIQEDELGFSFIYLQAKRWKSPVPIDHVRSFVGSLDGKKSQRGIMITTSSFSKQTYDYVKDIKSKIVLIDGSKLVEYMYEYDLGVKVKESYTIKEADDSFFE